MAPILNTHTDTRRYCYMLDDCLLCKRSHYRLCVETLHWRRPLTAWIGDMSRYSTCDEYFEACAAPGGERFGFGWVRRHHGWSRLWLRAARDLLQGTVQYCYSCRRQTLRDEHVSPANQNTGKRGDFATIQKIRGAGNKNSPPGALSFGE